MKDPDHRYRGIPLNLNDRRTTERFDLPDAHIELILQGIAHRNIKLIDITFNSIRVITSLMVKEEQDLLVKIKIPYKQPLSLKGFVLRLDEVYNKHDKFIVDTTKSDNLQIEEIESNIGQTSGGKYRITFRTNTEPVLIR